MKFKRLYSLLILIFLLSGCMNPSDVPIITSDSFSDSTTSTLERADKPEAIINTPISEAEPTPQNITGQLKISYLDVGQADSIYILLPNGESVLIDAGEQTNSEDIIQYVQDSGKDTLDYVIATHPHADHIGGMAAVINAFTVKNIYMPDKTHTTKTFENMIDAIDEKGLTFDIAKAGKVLFDYGNLKAEFIAPNGSGYEDLNDYSAVVLLTYNSRHFLFMGDAGHKSEAEILSNGFSVAADVLKVGHHGSNTSSGKSFIEKVSPKYAVISSGKGNSYGHPTAATLATLNSFNINIRRTDTEGTIIVTCDGENITLNSLKTEIQPRAPTAEPESASAPSVVKEAPAKVQEQSITVYATRTGKKYHADGCRYLSQSKIPMELKEARQKYEPCSVCKPPQ